MIFASRFPVLGLPTSARTGETPLPADMSKPIQLEDSKNGGGDFTFFDESFLKRFSEVGKRGEVFLKFPREATFGSLPPSYSDLSRAEDGLQGSAADSTCMGWANLVTKVTVASALPFFFSQNRRRCG